MNPKEKAQELVGKCFDAFINDEDEFYDKTAWRLSKQCALVAVNEVVEFMRMDDEYTGTASNANSKWVSYWIEVKREIEKL